MSIITKLLLLIVALEHIYIAIIEMYLIGKKGEKVFNLDKNFLNDKRVQVLFANQGLYNGFLAMGLLWSLFEFEYFQFQLALFFLMCVICASIYGGFTSSYKIIIKQGLPAFLALLSIIFIY